MRESYQLVSPVTSASRIVIRAVYTIQSDVIVCNMLLGVLAVVGLLQTVASAQTAVYVKFLSPPHGYTHNLQVTNRGGLAVAKEERIYPGDTRHPRFQQDWYHQNPSRPYVPKLYQPSLNRYQPPSENLYHPPSQSQYQSRPQTPYSTPNYFYSRPSKPFDEYGPPPQQYQNSRPPGQQQYQSDRPSEETFSRETGEYYNPAYSPHQNEVTYDPLLITGPQAAQYVAFLFSRGELFFHLIPHERLVLMNQQDRIENNLHPHVLASIRPGHPFFYH